MERVLDQQGRWRNKVVAFRMSPEEDEVLEAKVNPVRRRKPPAGRKGIF